MLKSVKKFPNVLLVSNWKIALIFLIFISGNITWTRSEEDRQDGKKIEVFIFSFIFL